MFTADYYDLGAGIHLVPFAAEPHKNCQFHSFVTVLKIVSESEAFV